jgi:hypothetical protein
MTAYEGNITVKVNNSREAVPGEFFGGRSGIPPGKVDYRPIGRTSRQQKVIVSSSEFSTQIPKTSVVH